jgi:hypothetical protein
MRDKKATMKELFKNGDAVKFKPIDVHSKEVINEIKKLRKEQERIMEEYKRMSTQRGPDIIFGK